MFNFNKLFILFFVFIILNNCNIGNTEQIQCQSLSDTFDRGGCFSSESYLAYFQYQPQKYLRFYSDTLNFGQNVKIDVSQKNVLGEPLKDEAADNILAHEIVGHAVPRVTKSANGNAVEDENKVRSELNNNPFIENRRAAEPSHNN